MLRKSQHKEILIVNVLKKIIDYKINKNLCPCRIF